MMIADPSLGMDITQMGILTSIFPIAYGVSKFVSGNLSDQFSPRLMLGGGLLMTGVAVTAFGFSSSLWLFALFYAFNGLFQGLGAPSCAKLLTAWYATKERGTFWGLWNISHNLGGLSAPIITSSVAMAFGWRYGFWVSGAIGIAVGALLLAFNRDSPEAAGYPPVELPEKQKTTLKEGSAAAEPEEKLSVRDNLMQNVLSNPSVWVLAVTFFCVYIVRQGVGSWINVYLMQTKGIPDLSLTSRCLAALEAGGLAGSLVAGRLSDYLIKANPTKGAVGQRVRVVMLYLTLLIGMLLTWQYVVPMGFYPNLVAAFFVGFCIYGPQMLVGLCGAEIVGRNSVGASEGFLGIIAYLGGACAGYPLSQVIRYKSWDGAFFTFVAAAAAAVLLLVPIRNAKSFVQLDDEEEEEEVDREA